MCWRRPSSKTADPTGAVRVCQLKGVFMGSVLNRRQTGLMALGVQKSAKAFVELGGSSLDRCLRSGAGQRVDKLARLPISRGARGGPRQGGGDHAEGGRARREQGHAPKRVGLKNKLDAVTKARGKDLGVDNAPVCCQGRYGNTRLGQDLGWIIVRPLVLGDHAGADERRLMCVSGILNKGRRLGGGLAIADLEEAHLRVRQP